MLAYGAGLRVSQICHPQMQDSDTKRMLIHVRERKGGLDRYVMLSPELRKTLRGCAKERCEKGRYLFPSRVERRMVSAPEDVQKWLRMAAKRAG